MKNSSCGEKTKKNASLGPFVGLYYKYPDVFEVSRAKKYASKAVGGNTYLATVFLYICVVFCL
jgi:hypothetical protein